MIKKLLVTLSVIALAISPALADRTVDLRWDLSPDSTVTMYEVVVNEGGQWTTKWTTDTNRITITDFPDGEVRIAVRAYNGVWSPYSALKTVPAAAPPAPTNIEVTSMVDNPEVPE